MMDRMMTCDSVDELLLDILEGELPADQRSAVDAHVSDCARCTSLLRDLEGVREAAATLPDLTPSSDLWKGIAARIETPVVSLGERKSRKFAAPVWMAAAASLLVIASSGITYWATSRSIKPQTVVQQVASAPAAVVNAEDAPAEPAAETPRQAEPIPVSGRASAPSVSAGARLVSNTRKSAFAPDTIFGSEIARLQRVIAERKNELDPQTVSVVEMNLKLIDAAIKSSRAALAKDPASGFLNQQLTRALDKKVELLRTVALMPSST